RREHPGRGRPRHLRLLRPRRGGQEPRPALARAALAVARPALGGALAFLDCEVEQDIPAGTHAVLIGAVRGIGLNPAASAHEPLVYFQGEYRPLLNRMRYPKPDDLPVLLADHFS